MVGHYDVTAGSNNTTPTISQMKSTESTREDERVESEVNIEVEEYGTRSVNKAATSTDFLTEASATNKECLPIGSTFYVPRLAPCEIGSFIIEILN